MFPVNARIRTFVAVGLCTTILHHSIWFRENQDIIMRVICKQPTSPTLPLNLSRFTTAPGFTLEAVEARQCALKTPPCSTIAHRSSMPV